MPAKDGTNRGGRRVGAGRKPDPLSQKALKGTLKNEQLAELPIATEIVGNDMPPIKEYLTELQRDGSKLCADEIYRETYVWICELGVKDKVNNLLIEQYAMSVARWVDVERQISRTGYLAKHPTTGQAIGSPFVQMAQSYFKQVTNAWYQIYSLVREHSGDVINGGTPQDNLMEKMFKDKGM